MCLLNRHHRHCRLRACAAAAACAACRRSQAAAFAAGPTSRRGALRIYNKRLAAGASARPMPRGGGDNGTRRHKDKTVWPRGPSRHAQRSMYNITCLIINRVRRLHGRAPTAGQLQRLHGALRRRLRQVLQLLAARSEALQRIQQQHDVTMHAAVQGCAGRSVCGAHMASPRIYGGRYPGALATLQQTVEACKQLAALRTSLAASIAEHAMMMVRLREMATTPTSHGDNPRHMQSSCRHCTTVSRQSWRRPRRGWLAGRCLWTGRRRRRHVVHQCGTSHVVHQSARKRICRAWAGRRSRLVVSRPSSQPGRVGMGPAVFHRPSCRAAHTKPGRLRMLIVSDLHQVKIIETDGSLAQIDEQSGGVVLLDGAGKLDRIV